MRRSTAYFYYRIELPGGEPGSMFLTDDQWSLVKPLLPDPPPSSAVGRPLLDDRLVLDAVLWKLSTGVPWDVLPPSFPSRNVCYRRYRQWLGMGVIGSVLSALYQDLVARGGFDPASASALMHVRVSRQGRSLVILADPQIQKTWQPVLDDSPIYRTAALIYNLAFSFIRRRAP
jgi:transposase